MSQSTPDQQVDDALRKLQDGIRDLESAVGKNVDQLNATLAQDLNGLQTAIAGHAAAVKRLNDEAAKELQEHNRAISSLRETISLYKTLSQNLQQEIHHLRIQQGNLKGELRQSERDLKASKDDAAGSEKLGTPLVALIVVGLVLAAYGIAQPFILDELGFSVQSMSEGATILEALVAVVALLVAGFGVAAYATVERAVKKSVNKRVSRYGDKIWDRTAQAVGATRINEAYSQWGVLEPLLWNKPVADTAEESRRNELIDTAIAFARSAQNYAVEESEADSAGKNLADQNLAFYLACKYTFEKPQSGGAAAEALGLVPPSIKDLDADAAETVTWVRMCCLPEESDDWETARRTAAELWKQREEHDPGKGEAMRLRYQATFGERVFELS